MGDTGKTLTAVLLPIMVIGNIFLRTQNKIARF